MSKAGANFGMDLLWAVLLSCIITYYLINLFSKYTMVTGETVIQGMKKHISPTLVIILIVALSVIIVVALSGLLGIMADVLSAWSGTIVKGGISMKIWAVAIAAVVYLVLLAGNYSMFEKILAVLVAIMGISFIASLMFILSMAMVIPDLTIKITPIGDPVKIAGIRLIPLKRKV